MQSLGTGESQFEIELSHVPAGEYEIVINGVTRSTITLEGEGDEAEGKVEFETNPDDEDERLLDFEVFDLPIEIKKNGIVYFSGIVPNPSSGGGSQGGGSPIPSTAPESIVELSWILDNGTPSDRLDFTSETEGNRIDLSPTTGSDEFTYTYTKINEIEAKLIVTYKGDGWDEIDLNFDSGTYIVKEYKDGSLDKLDAGTLKNG